MKTFQWLCVLLLLVVPSINAHATPLIISNPGFETVESVDDGLPATFGNWSGDLAAIVTAENGITPNEGSRMIRFTATFETGPGGISSDIWQLVDMSPFSAEIALGTATVSWSASFNRVADIESEPQFAVSIRAFSGLPAAFPTIANSPLASDVTFLMSDADPGTWETITTNLLLPSETTYVAVLVAARETLSDSESNEFVGHYADQAQVQVVPEPATLSLVGAGLAAAARSRKKKAQRTPAL
jgi:hypothetical protein